MGLFQSCFFWYDIDTVKDRELTKRTSKTGNNTLCRMHTASGCSYRLLHLVAIGSNYAYKHCIWLYVLPSYAPGYFFVVRIR